MQVKQTGWVIVQIKREILSIVRVSNRLEHQECVKSSDWSVFSQQGMNSHVSKEIMWLPFILHSDKRNEHI